VAHTGQAILICKSQADDFNLEHSEVTEMVSWNACS